MPTTYNAITGLKRKAARRDLSRKKRATQSSTVASRRYAEQAMEQFHCYIFGCQLQLVSLGIICNTPQLQGNQQARAFAVMLFLGASIYYLSAIHCLVLDSRLLDLHDHDEANSGFSKELQDITLESFDHDDECEAKTRFTKEAITSIIGALNQPDVVRLYYAQPSERYYKFKVETLVIYMLRKMSTARTHCDLCDNEFGGSSTRWAVGYKWIVKLFNTRFSRLIGPTALGIWAPQFPTFAEKIREYIQRDKERTDGNGNQIIRGMPLQHIGPGQFNVFSVTDCTVYEVCRPGSGPANNNNGAGRRQGWYIKQRAFYDGYHRGMEACVKILTICLPNGMTAAVYGPTSGREGDMTLFRLSEFDDYLRDLCAIHHNNTMYATYGDDIFAGYWYCLRTKHKPAPGLPLTPIQEEENDNMKSVREMVEWSYAKAEQNWPMLNRKETYKLEQEPDRVWAEIRVMYLLTNFKVCELEGSTMTGTRGFACPPPTLSEYLAM
jgi:hypothetical protein